MGPSVAARATVLDRLLELRRALLGRGIAVSVADTVDATHAVAMIDIGDRELLRTALRASLVKQDDPTGIFDELFERYFPLQRPRVGTPVDVSDRAAIAAQLAGGDDLNDVADALVDEFGGFDTEMRSERYHTQRVLRAADLAKLMDLALHGDLEAVPADVRQRIEELKRLIAFEVHERIGAPDTEPGPDLSNVQFLEASRAELASMRSEVRPLARRIVSRLARRRQRATAGQVDVRRTIRRSLSTGGVPLDLAMRRRHPHHPELFVLCDISGSVAEFSLFTLTLVAALSAELPRTRSFVFVDAVDEITDLLKRTGHHVEPWQILRNTNVIGADGHSDYGAVFDEFWDRVGESDLTARSTVVIAGDGRCNYRPPRSESLGKIARRARAVYWFNPESARDWYSHDSAMEDYEAHCRQVFEVRDLQQLAASIDHIV